MLKQLFALGAALACPILAQAQPCHPYAMPDAMLDIGYTQYTKMAQEEKLPAPPSPAAFEDTADRIRQALCELDARAQGIGPLPPDFHYAPSAAMLEQKRYLDPHNLKRTEQALDTPEARANIDYLLQRPLLVRMISALMDDVDYRKQEIAARYAAARRPAPEDLDTMVQQETLQAVRQIPYTLGAGNGAPAQ